MAAFAASPVLAEEAGSQTGSVTFRVTLSGPVDDADAFLVVSRCDDPWCQDQAFEDGPIEHPVVACGAGLADAPVCSVTTYEWTVELQTGTLEYEFVRIRDVQGANERQVQHVGSWEVHGGQQTLSFGYVYGGSGTGGNRGSGAPTLPDTAVPAP